MIKESLQENNKIGWSLLFSPYFLVLVLFSSLIELIVLGFIIGIICYFINDIILKNKRISWLIIGVLLSLFYIIENYLSIFNRDSSVLLRFSSLTYLVSIPSNIFLNVFLAFLVGAIIGYVIDTRYYNLKSNKQVAR